MFPALPGWRPPAVVLQLMLCLSATFVVMIAGDWLVTRALPTPWRMAARLLDAPVHGLLGLAVVIPLLAWSLPRRQAIFYAIAAIVLGAVLDVDHSIASHSFSLTRMVSLPSRPITHSLTFALISASLAGLLLQWIHPQGIGHRIPVGALPSRPVTIAWFIFAILAAHVLRDASSGATPYLWPLAGYRIPIPVYYAGEILLCLLSAALALRGA